MVLSTKWTLRFDAPARYRADSHILQSTKFRTCHDFSQVCPHSSTLESYRSNALHVPHGLRGCTAASKAAAAVVRQASCFNNKVSQRPGLGKRHYRPITGDQSNCSHTETLWRQRKALSCPGLGAEDKQQECVMAFSPAQTHLLIRPCASATDEPVQMRLATLSPPR